MSTTVGIQTRLVPGLSGTFIEVYKATYCVINYMGCLEVFGEDAKGRKVSYYFRPESFEYTALHKKRINNGNFGRF
jgi:hypothetical protein